MRKYCKAYRVKDLKKFPGWKVQVEHLRPEKRIVDGKEVEVPRQLRDEDVLYLHEDFVVTDGIYRNENVVFEAVTPEWKQFCTRVLKFSVPDFDDDFQVKEKKSK